MQDAPLPAQLAPTLPGMRCPIRSHPTISSLPGHAAKTPCTQQLQRNTALDVNPQRTNQILSAPAAVYRIHSFLNERKNSFLQIKSIYNSISSQRFLFYNFVFFFNTKKALVRKELTDTEQGSEGRVHCLPHRALPNNSTQNRTCNHLMLIPRKDLLFQLPTRFLCYICKTV